MAVIKSSEFDANKVNFGEARNLSNGKIRMIPVTYGDNKEPLVLQTPMNMRVPFGVSKFDEKLSL